MTPYILGFASGLLSAVVIGAGLVVTGKLIRDLL